MGVYTDQINSIKLDTSLNKNEKFKKIQRVKKDFYLNKVNSFLPYLIDIDGNRKVNIKKVSYIIEENGAVSLHIYGDYIKEATIQEYDWPLIICNPIVDTTEDAITELLKIFNRVFV